MTSAPPDDAAAATPPLATPTVETVLVPVDGTEEAERAVEYAVTIAERYGASVHAVYVLGEGIVRGIESGTIDDEDVAAETRGFIETVDDIAAAHDVPFSTSTAYGFSTQSKLHHPGSVILDTAEDVDADFLVIPREPLTGNPGEVLGKAAEYALLYASQPVLSV